MAPAPSKPSTPLYVLLVCSLLLNLFQFLHHGSPQQANVAVTAEMLDEDDTEESTAPVAGPATAKPTELPASAAPVAGATSSQDGWTALGSKVQESLARTFQKIADDDGDALSSVFTRLFVWDVDMRKDLKVGDSLAVVWRKAPDGLPEIAAGSLQSAKLGRTLVAYRWQAPGDQFPSYWHPDGTEAPLRLKDGPLESYDQITSLLKDRPTHKGMDFKTPTGTEVHAPKAGTVLRVNWNWGANGNCIEIQYGDGTLAKFLHLSENRVKEGDRVSAGQVLALTGNTGHSTAPHLHYQLDHDNKTIDPLDYHGTERRSLSPEQTAAMKKDVAGYDKLLADAAVQ